MVSKPPISFSTLKSDFKASDKTIIILTLIIVTALTATFLFYFSDKNYTKSDSAEPTITTTEKNLSSESKTDLKNSENFIDFNETLAAWGKSLPEGVSAGAIIYDLDNNKIAGELNSGATFPTASVYKLFVVYAGYEKVEKKEWDRDLKLANGKSIDECLDSALRSSDSTCAELLVSKIGEAELSEIIKNSYNLDIEFDDYVATPTEIMKMLKIYYEHPTLSSETYSKILDSMLNQPKIYSEELCGGYCNWRMGLPSGFSDSIKAYNKVGWSYNSEDKKWEVYNDAAIISLASESSSRNYIVVVMTKNLSADSSPYITELNNLALSIENNLKN